METAIRIKSLSDIKTDSICYWYEDNSWWIYLPKCGAGRLDNHSVFEYEDKTITVKPSILLTGHDNGISKVRHGYLTKGIWNEI